MPEGLPGPLPPLLVTLGLQRQTSSALQVDTRIPPCNCQLAQFKSNLPRFIEAAIDSLRVLVWIHSNGLRLTWSLTGLLACWPLELTCNWLSICQPQLGVLIKHLSICNLSLSNADDLSFSGVATHLWRIGLWNPHKILSATVNLNSIDISRHFADLISALKCGWYRTCQLCVLTYRKGVIHDIQLVKRISGSYRAIIV
jgi:hypothetical protein